MSHERIDRATLDAVKARYHQELYDSVIPFWMKHSLDREYGGYFNCLDRDGKLFDTKKYIWLQGRQVWMLSRMHNLHHQPGEESEYLEAAKLGADFLRKYAREENRVYFCLTQDGLPVKLQRKIFSECFYVMGLAEYARASGDDSARQEAQELFRYVVEYARNPALVGKPDYGHMKPDSALAIPMILLNLIDEVNGPEGDDYQDLKEWCVNKMHLHIRPELHLVLEHVGADGKLLDSPEGRVVNPGHALEAGWFLLDHATKVNNEALVKTCLNMIEWSFDFGWDEEQGGLFYYLDREGYSPLALEWNMKLWWPHCEALIAYIKAYEATKERRFFDRFIHLSDYTFDHFSDPEYGEWYGYLDRQGKVSQRFKGAPYKGCFHVPRALLYVEQSLDRLSKERLESDD